AAERRSSSNCPRPIPTRKRLRPRMTDRLYYADAYCRDFSATITRVDRRDGRTIVVLDRTAFYPTSGGQPFDRGALAVQERRARHVVDVLDEEDGSVAHVLGDEEPRADAEPAVG